jgi:HD-GYP domain-containing protein (c-di-GMP phosphodiesterase class II)
VDYLTKPFGRERLRDAVARGLEWHQSAWDARRWRETLDDEMNRRRRRLADAIGSVRVECHETLDAMLSMLTSGDREAYAHAHRVADLATRLARALAVPNSALSVIGQGALLHDLGKLAMPEAILRKPAPLTLEEQALVRQHPVIGAELVAAVPYLSAVASLVGAVRERMDGHGYPNGLAADSVPLGARIIAVADAYDTMTRPRVFRNALSAGEAMLELERCRGTQFDPAIVDALKALVVTD